MIVHIGTWREVMRVRRALQTLNQEASVCRYLRRNGAPAWAVTSNDLAGWAARALVALLFDHGVHADKVTEEMLSHFDYTGEVKR